MSNNGIKTSFWGPHAWGFLFSSIAGAYPVRVDQKNPKHTRVVKSFQKMIKSLEDTLPCVYCRDSYKRFLKELPLSEYSGSRMDMLKWLYLIHDKVNQKLIKQEKECYESTKVQIMKMGLKPDQLKKRLKVEKENIIKTKPSPSFDKVVAMYEKQRAGCSKKTKRCS